ncbi:MAG: hypothetical protein JXR73_16190 [Candidatus Omnitrophica bacterium]|nr:hypothetical protein [Candidatus Omnitrophota bacterium]
MTPQSRFDPRLFLGSGGDKPRVVAVDPETRETDLLFESSPGNSVYFLARSPNGRELAVGTKCGDVSLLDGIHPVSQGSPPSIRRFRLGAPILAMKFLPNSILLASDAAGNSYMIDSRCMDQFLNLPTEHQIVCSFALVSEDLLCGLSVEGKIFFWDVPHGNLLHIASTCRPPPLSSFVQLLFCPASRRLVHPCQSGELASYHLREKRAQRTPAHRGEWYAMAEYQGILMTIGMRDSRMKLWSAADMQLDQDYFMPRGILSAQPLREKFQQVLWINADGRAGIGENIEDAYQPIWLLEGNNYRTASGPLDGPLKQMSRRHREAAAQTLAEQIQSRLRKGRNAEAEHAQLQRMGYSHVSLLLRAEAAYQRNDPVAELRYRTELATMLPSDRAEVIRSYVRYAELLERFWFIEEAYHVCENLPPPYSADASPRLMMMYEALRDNDWMIEPHLPLPQRMQACGILGQSFQGRWILNVLDSFSLASPTISPQAMRDKYEQIRTEESTLHLPRARCGRICHASASTVRMGDWVSVRQNRDPGEGAFEFGFFAAQEDGHTIFTPLTVYVVEGKPAESSIAEHNRRVQEAFEQAMTDKTANLWIQSVHRALNQAVRRLKSAWMSSRMDLRG